MAGSVHVVNHALLRPILLGGVEKRFALANSVLSFTFIAASRLQWPGVIIGPLLFVVLHTMFIAAANVDSELSVIFKRATRYILKPYFPATGSIHSPTAMMVHSIPSTHQLGLG